jgi:hypothetical protein
VQVEIFDAVGCAAVEVGELDGDKAMQQMQNALICGKPVIVSNLIEFPDEPLIAQLRHAHEQVSAATLAEQRADYCRPHKRFICQLCAFDRPLKLQVLEM